MERGRERRDEGCELTFLLMLTDRALPFSVPGFSIFEVQKMNRASFFNFQETKSHARPL